MARLWSQSVFGNLGLARTSVQSPRTKNSDDGDFIFGGEVFLEEDDGMLPLQRLTRRVHNVNKTQFENLISKPGVYHVDDPDRSVQAGGVLDLMGAQLVRPSPGIARVGTNQDGAGDNNGLPPAKNRKFQRAAGLAAPRHSQRTSIFRMRTFRPDNKLYMWWTSFILLLDLTYTSFVIPISIGMLTSFWNWNWTSIMDYACGFMFCIDMILSFHAGFVAVWMSRKVLVLDGKLIAQHYLKSMFFFDAASVLAWLLQICLLIAHTVQPDVDYNTASYIMEVVRLIRFMRIIPLIRSLSESVLNSSNEKKKPRHFQFLSNAMFVYSMLLLYISLVMVNFTGCLWNFVAGVQNYDNTWVNTYPPFLVAVGTDQSSLTEEEIDNDLSHVYMYFAGTYWALTTIVTIGYGDIVPKNLAENLVCQLVELVAIIFQALVFGFVVELVRRGNTRARRLYELRAKMDVVDRWMKANNLPPDLQSKIKGYYAEIWVQQLEGLEDIKMFRELPHLLQNEVAYACTASFLKKCIQLKDLSDEKLHLLTGKMFPVKWGPGAEIAAEGDLADRLWVLMEGEVLAVYHFRDAEVCIAPCLLGESVLLQEIEPELRNYPCTFRTLTHCSAWCLRWKDVKSMLRHDPGSLANVSSRALHSVSMHMRQNPNLWTGKSFKSDTLSRMQSRYNAADHLARNSTYSTYSERLFDVDEDKRQWGRRSRHDSYAALAEAAQAALNQNGGGRENGGEGQQEGTIGGSPTPRGVAGYQHRPSFKFSRSQSGKTVTNSEHGSGAGGGEDTEDEIQPRASGSALRSIMLIRDGGGAGGGMGADTNNESGGPSNDGRNVAASPFAGQQQQEAQLGDTAHHQDAGQYTDVSFHDGQAGLAPADPSRTLHDSSASEVLNELRHLRQEVSVLRHHQEQRDDLNQI